MFILFHNNAIFFHLFQFLFGWLKNNWYFRGGWITGGMDVSISKWTCVGKVPGLLLKQSLNSLSTGSSGIDISFFFSALLLSVVGSNLSISSTFMNFRTSKSRHASQLSNVHELQELTGRIFDFCIAWKGERSQLNELFLLLTILLMVGEVIWVVYKRKNKRKKIMCPW